MERKGELIGSSSGIIAETLAGAAKGGSIGIAVHDLIGGVIDGLRGNKNI